MNFGANSVFTSTVLTCFILSTVLFKSLVYKIFFQDITKFMIMYATYLEKAMATQSSTLAWKIPWTKEPGGLQSMGSLRVGHD